MRTKPPRRLPCSSRRLALGKRNPGVERKGNRNGQYHHYSCCRRCFVCDRAGDPHPAPPHSHQVTAASGASSATRLIWAFPPAPFHGPRRVNTAGVPAFASSYRGSRALFQPWLWSRNREKGTRDGRYHADGECRRHIDLRCAGNSHSALSDSARLKQTVLD